MTVETQTWLTERYDRNARFVSDLGAPVLDLLAPLAGERVLDLGCGDGVLTQRIAEAGAEVLGVDMADDLLATAREAGLKVEKMDGQALTFEDEFDAVFSNAAMHWMLDPDAVIAGVVRALKPGGRFVGEFGGFGNVAAIVTAMIAALARRGHDGAARICWYFPTPEDYASRLEGHGFGVESIELIPRPTPLPTDMRGWLETFGENFVSMLPADERGEVLDEAVALLRPSLCAPDGRWTADYVRLRFRAHLR
jgi:SAM-dependent methyltransferase